MELKDLKEARTFAINFGVKAIVYGPAGTGKTPIANTAPRPVLLATEPGLLSMRKSTIPTWVGNTKDRIDEFFKWFFNSNDSKNFDTLVIDSVSQMCEIALEDAKRRIKHGQAQYGDMADYVMPYMERLYFMQNKHMYLIAKEEKQESGFLRPYYPGRVIPVAIPHRYDLITRVAKVQLPNIGEVTAFQCNGTYEVMARNRIGTLDTFEQPDFANIIRKCMQ